MKLLYFENLITFMLKLNIWKHEKIALGLRAKLLPDFLLHIRVLFRHKSGLHLKNNSVPCYMYSIAVLFSIALVNRIVLLVVSTSS
jgi:hypothetical protein